MGNVEGIIGQKEVVRLESATRLFKLLLDGFFISQSDYLPSLIPVVLVLFAGIFVSDYWRLNELQHEASFQPWKVFVFKPFRRERCNCTHRRCEMSDIFSQRMDKAIVALATTPKEHLGDRSNYIGGSDQDTCLLMMYYRRVQPVPPSPQTAMKFLRGHAAEEIWTQIFKTAGLNPIREKRVIHPDHPEFQANLDFIFVNQNSKTVKYLELKSVDEIPAEPRESHLNQMAYGTNILALQEEFVGWNIEGAILYCNLNSGEYEIFNGHTAESLKPAFEKRMEASKILWSALHGGPQPEPTPCASCGWCPYTEECRVRSTKGLNQLPSEVSRAAQNYAIAKDLADSFSAEAKRHRQLLVDYAGKGKITGLADDLVVRVSPRSGGFSINQKKLSLLVSPEIVSECMTKNKDKVVVEVKPLMADPTPA